MPSYGEETDAIHDRVLHRLTEAPAYRARYETIDAGVELIGRL
jgi:hypothetical protein